MPAGWAVVTTLGLVLVILTVVILTVRRIFSRVEERQALEDTAARLEAEKAEEQKRAKEHAQVADARGRDLGPDPGFRVRRKDKRSGGDPPPGPA